jgi:hypothetical protein
MKILLTHPNLIGIVDRVQEKCSAPIIGSSNYQEVLNKIAQGEVEKLGIVFEVTGIDSLELIKKVYALDPTLPILAWDCVGLHFDELGDYQELLEDHIFYINSKDLKGDPFFEMFDKFYCGTLIPFNFLELEKT